MLFRSPETKADQSINRGNRRELRTRKNKGDKINPEKQSINKKIYREKERTRGQHTVTRIILEIVFVPAEKE